MTASLGTAPAPAPGTTPADRPSRGAHAAMFALARVEGWRLLRHPAVLAATALVLLNWVGPVVSGSADRFPVLHYAAFEVQFGLLVLPAAGLVAANLAVLRAHRHRADVFYAVLPLSAWRRTCAHLLAVLPLAAAAMVFAVARLAHLAALPGAVGRPDPLELAAVPALVVLFGAVGVLLGRLVRSAVVAPLVLAALAFVWLFGLNQYFPYRLRWLSPVAPLEGLLDPQPAELLGRPAGAHLIYLVALGGLVAAVALLLSRAPRVPVGVLAAVAAVVVVVAGAAQVRPPTTELTARRTTAMNEPSGMQRCVQRDRVTYCAFPEFLPRVDQWDRVVDGVRQRLPADRADQPFTVRQRLLTASGAEVTWTGSSWNPTVVNDSWRADDLRAGTPGAVSVGTGWGGPHDEPAFAARVAHRLVTGAEATGDNKLLCGGLAVVTLWLAGQATPESAAGLPELAAGTFGRAVDFNPANVGPALLVGKREVDVAIALLGQPADRVAEVVTRSWPELTSPDTGLERVAEILKVSAPARLAPVPAGEESIDGDCG